MSDLESTYRERHESVLVPLAGRLAVHLGEHFKRFKRIDRISARAKAVDRFVQKAAKQARWTRKKGTLPRKSIFSSSSKGIRSRFKLMVSFI